MLKLFLIASFILSLMTSLNAETGIKPLQVSIYPPLQTPNEGNTIGGLRLNLIWGKSRNVYGFDFGLINMTNELSAGIATGFSNASQEHIGFQIGAMNRTEKFRGLQFGLFNRGGATFGCQAGFINSGKELKGIQFGVMSGTTDFGGIQIGGININGGRSGGLILGACNLGNEVYGLSFGIFNFALHHHGLQLGLLNINMMGPVPIMVGLNFDAD